MRVLLVEDEDGIAAFVSKGLSAEGHSVERASTMREGCEMASASEFGVVLLDLKLPDGDGRDVLRRVRASRPETPVIVVSAHGEVEDKVDLLDLGADDYLVKPFALAELAARVRVAGRNGRSSVLQAGELELDTRTRVVRYRGMEADLPTKEYCLLEYLMRNPDRVLTRQQILDEVWGYQFDPGSNIVDVYVGYLRRKLDTPGYPSPIETVRGAGYRVRT